MLVTDENALLPGLSSHEEEEKEMELHHLHHDEEQQEEDENDFQGFDLEVEDDKVNDNNSSITSDSDAIAMATAETTSDTGTIRTRNKASRTPSGIALAFAKPDVSPEEAEEYIKKHLMPDAMLREASGMRCFLMYSSASSGETSGFAKASAIPEGVLLALFLVRMVPVSEVVSAVAMAMASLSLVMEPLFN
ncbi:Hypothetical protein NocV09_03400230 [Nannochloropsis oceanica]